MASNQRVDIAEKFLPLFAPARYKAAYGGRGSGKSHSMARALVSMAASKPLRILCAREVQKSIKQSVRQLLEDVIYELGLSGHYTILRDEIRGRNGTLIVFSGLQDLTVDQIKSYEGFDIAWVEEAHTISARSLEVLKPTIRKPQSELWFSWNPRHASDPVDEMFRGQHAPENAIIIDASYKDNPWFSQEMEMERRQDRAASRDRYGHVWLGDYEPTAIGAIWDRVTLHEGRLSEVPDDLERILVSVDHATSAAPGSNEHGIIVGGLGSDQRGYILEDGSTSGSPHKWATRAVALFDYWQADAIVIERNQGGDLVRANLQTIRPDVPIVEVTATRGKHVRAEPISSLYSLGRVSHVGTFPELEDQMCRMTTAGYEGEGSPDRVDALVWLLTKLFPGMTKRDPKASRSELKAPPVAIGGWMGS